MGNAAVNAKANKGNAFNGLWAGRRYLFLAKIFGFTQPFYERALGDLDVSGDMKVVDMGCGPGVLGFTLSHRLSTGSVLYGVDLAKDMIHYANEQLATVPIEARFSVGSMDELPFDNDSVDLVMTSMALHETSPSVRPKAISEAVRILKPGGRFLLVDWSKPRFGFWSAVWLPFLLFGESNDDNWNNTYKTYCSESGLNLIEDYYINSITRRQLYQK